MSGAGRATNREDEDARLEAAFCAGFSSAAGAATCAAGGTSCSTCFGIGAVCFVPGDCSSVDVAEGEGQGTRHHGGGRGLDVRAVGGLEELPEIPCDLFLDDPEGTILVDLCTGRGGGGGAWLVVHGDVAVGVGRRGDMLGWPLSWVEPGSLLTVGGNDGDLVGVVTG